MSFSEFKQISEAYNLPIVFAYNTFLVDRHGMKCEGYQVAFLNDIAITDPRIIEIM